MNSSGPRAPNLGHSAPDFTLPSAANASVTLAHACAARIVLQRMHVQLLSDFQREVTRQYGVLQPARCFSNRAFFLIDTPRATRWRHVEKYPGQRRGNAEILAEIAKLR